MAGLVGVQPFSFEVDWSSAVHTGSPNLDNWRLEKTWSDGSPFLLRLKMMVQNVASAE